MSLTVTVYMVVQGIAPSFWGPLSDARGRRITFIGTFAVYLIANVALALSRDFASLMVFRALQAAGSAATISVGQFPYATILASANISGRRRRHRGYHDFTRTWRVHGEFWRE